MAQSIKSRYSSRKISTQDGLADMTTWSLFQDKKGYMWTGTLGGLTRFDGIRCKNYYVTDGLRDNACMDIISIGADTISVLTATGISFITSDSVSTIPLPPGYNAEHWSYQAVQGNKLYLFNFLSKANTVDGRLRHYVLDLSTQKLVVQEALNSLDIIKVFGGGNGPIRAFARNGGYFSIDKGATKKLGVFADDLFDICALSDTSYCYYDIKRQGFYFLSVGRDTFSTRKYIDHPVNAMPYKRNMAVAQDGAIYIYKGNDTIARLNKGVVESFIVADDAYFDMLVDNHGSLWLASSHGLITYFNFNFSEIAFDKTKNGLVLNVLQDKKSRFWFSGHNNGIWYKDGDKIKDIAATSIQQMSNLSREYYSAQNWGATTLRNGKLLFPYALGLIEIEDGRYINHHQLPFYCHAVAEDKNGNIYAGTQSGLFKFDFKKGFTQLNSKNVALLYNDKKENLWVITGIGAGILKNDSVHIEQALDSLRIFTLDQDQEGMYWLGTTNGLYYYNGKDKPARVAPSIFRTEVKAVLAYNSEKLVVADNQVLAFLDLRSFKNGNDAWITFNRYSGYTGEDVIGKKLFKDNAGNVWLLGEEKVITFNPAEIVRKRKQPAVYIESFLFSADNINWQSNAAGKEVFLLRPLEKNIRIEFLSVYLADPSGVRYQYRLQGIDEEWSSPVQGNDVVYSNLAPGNYTFEVRASADGINWSGSTDSLSFYIPRLWYRTIWFYILASLALLAAIWWLSRYYIRSKLRKQLRALEKQLAVEQERHRISNEIHDDLGAGLSGIRLQAELAAQKASSPEMKIELSRIYAVASELSTKMREVIWSLNTENDKLEKLLYYMRQEAFKMFEHSAIEFRCIYPNEIPIINVSGDKRRNIHLLVKEALHNALKHSGAQSVWLQAALVGDKLHLSIRDNGKGFREWPVAGDGNGIRNMHNRAHKMGAQLNIINHQGATVLYEIDLELLAK